MSDENSDDRPAGPGAELRETREGMEVSVREVADALNLPARVIEALESDDYERLPPTVFTRGYLRSYARLLELSPDAMLARYPEVTEELDAVTGESAVTPAAPATSNTPLLYGGIGLAALVVIGLAWVLLGDEETKAPEPVVAAGTDTEARPETEGELPATVATDSSPQSGDPTAESRIDEPEPEPESIPIAAPEAAADVAVGSVPEPVAGADSPRAAAPADTLESGDGEGDEPAASAAPTESRRDVAAAERPASVAEGPTVDTALEEPVPPAASTEPDPSATTDSAVATPPSSAAAPVPTLRERRITEFGDDELRFVFAEDCWVEVRNADGENLYSDLNRAGATLVLTGRAPFRILLGYAPGVSLDFNGESVPLDRYSRNNVANVTLGE